MTTLNDFAPYPKTEDEATADRLAQSIAVSAFTRQQLVDEYMQDATPEGKRLYTSAIGLLINEYGIAFLLRELADVDPEHANAAAKRLWGDWEDGASVAERLWEWVSEYGFDPGEVSRVAADQAREFVAKLKGAA